MIVVFKKGTSSTFKGIECDSKRINISQLRAYEKDGWTTDHNELAPDPEVKPDQIPARQEKFKKHNKG